MGSKRPDIEDPPSEVPSARLDPVDDLVPGKYVINAEIGDACRGPTNHSAAYGINEPTFTDYRTLSSALATFQVKQATAEKPIADGCSACHWISAGVGFVWLVRVCKNESLPGETDDEMDRGSVDGRFPDGPSSFLLRKQGSVTGR